MEITIERFGEKIVYEPIKDCRHCSDGMLVYKPLYSRHFNEDVYVCIKCGRYHVRESNTFMVIM